jgi:hypothetical protein
VSGKEELKGQDPTRLEQDQTDATLEAPDPEPALPESTQPDSAGNGDLDKADAGSDPKATQPIRIPRDSGVDEMPSQGSESREREV